MEGQIPIDRDFVNTFSGSLARSNLPVIESREDPIELKFMVLVVLRERS